jgi:hypothetical protein
MQCLSNISGSIAIGLCGKWKRAKWEAESRIQKTENRIQNAEPRMNAFEKTIGHWQRTSTR